MAVRVASLAIWSIASLVVCVHAYIYLDNLQGLDFNLFGAQLEVSVANFMFNSFLYGLLVSGLVFYSKQLELKKEYAELQRMMQIQRMEHDQKLAAMDKELKLNIRYMNRVLTNN